MTKQVLFKLTKKRPTKASVLFFSFSCVVTTSFCFIGQSCFGQDLGQSTQGIVSIEQSPKGDILYLGPKKVTKKAEHSEKMDSILFGGRKSNVKTNVVLTSPNKDKVVATSVMDKNFQAAGLLQSDGDKNRSRQVGFRQSTAPQELTIQESHGIDETSNSLRSAPSKELLPVITISNTSPKTEESPSRPYAFFPEKALTHSVSSGPNAGIVGIAVNQEKGRPARSSIDQWKLIKLQDIHLSNEHKGIIPTDQFQASFPEATSHGYWPQNSINTTAYWDAPNICFRRLYTEDPLLERYGQSSCSEFFQVGRSAAHFGASAFRFPLLFLKDRKSVRTPVGFHRPGSPVPTMYEKMVPGL